MLSTRKSAMLAGHTKYFTGKSCKHGHTAERYTNGGVCSACVYLSAYKYHETHREQKVKSTKIWRKRNPQYYNLLYERNPELSQFYTNRWKANNPDKVALMIERRRNILMRATPKWYERDKVQKLYQKRDELSKLWNVDLTVDHVIPLQGKNVCGLHCWLNLQLIERKENGRKRNKFEG